MEAVSVLFETLANKWLPTHWSLPETYVDLSGRTVIITGASSGLGLEAAQWFYDMNPGKLILAVRNLTKGEAAKEQIIDGDSKKGSGTQKVWASTEGRPDVEVWHLDMADFASVKQFAKRCNTELERIDVFIANAAVCNGDWTVTKDHWEVNIQVNIISTFLLFLRIMPKAIETSKLPPPKCGVDLSPHMAIITSDTHYFAPFEDRDQPNIFAALNTKERYTVPHRYFKTKLMSVLLTRHLGKKLKFSRENTGVVFCTVNPGFCRSHIMDATVSPLTLKIVFAIFGRATREGAKTYTWATLNEEIPQGSYTSSCKVTVPSRLVCSAEGDRLSAKLWDELVAILDEVDPENSHLWRD
ncbi:related to short-chain dehydrogenase, putative-Aspergillus fumigatus [Serendipita indica DSM 11827]|uniref:Related to short-chain dehydrogenase, putative-Aspergillus fumigatus n=1 Tax=Serendipita indica (strain DSM 11827) TaxID=1109443 RepID=G4TUR9_SERID|nr:related to short-chain dehydrogenase, putative-Aspergillus fumigatus [Serendipita indica DSM 11827]